MSLVWLKMNNPPLGAEYEPLAPYNAKEEKVPFSITISGTAWYDYYGQLDYDEMYKALIDRFRAALETCGDIDVSTINMSLY